MSATTQLLVRAARDRVADLLGIGETYPLQDVTVSADRLTVAVNTSAKISISPGQTDVTYTLHDRNDQPVSDSIPGTGAETVLTTPPIKEDQTFRIFASKIDVFASTIRRQDFLTQVAEVKVGLDNMLTAFIDAPLLDPLNDHPLPTDPRIVDYGSSVSVKVEESQEGVDYNLAVVVGDQETVVSQQDVRGNLDTVMLASKPMQEDTELRVRATKRFDPSEGRQDQTLLLDVKMPLMVRARPDLAVSVSPSPSPYHGNVTVKIAGTQTSASYLPYVRTLGDGDFVYGLPADPNRLPVGPNVQVPSPPLTAPFVAPDGFTKVGGYKPGTGGEIHVTLPQVVEDSVLIVEARKEHGPAKTPSSIQLRQATLALPRPNPSPALTVEATVENNAVPGPLLVSGGVPGTFYLFRVGDQGTEIVPGAYFHKLDLNDSTSNKGVDQLRIGIDLVLARDPSGTAQDPVHTPPPRPLLDIGPQALGITLFVRAIKARTGIDAPLTATALIPALPVIRLDQPIVPSGTAVKIVVAASVQGERYRPFLTDGTPVAGAQDGNGADLSFTSQPITKDTTFLVRVTQPGAAGIPVTRTVSLTAKVQ